MHKVLQVLALITFATFSVVQTSGSAETVVLAPVRQFVDAFNKGDIKTMLASCADQTSILDEFPPHEWHGTGSCAKWVSDFDADAKKNGITDEVVALSKPSHVDITGDRAYLVISRELQLQAEEEAGQRSWLHHYAQLAKGPVRLAKHGLVLGEH